MDKSSALLGAPPNNLDDALIRKGMLMIAPSELNPVPGQPFGPPRPADYHFESWQRSMRIGVAFAIAIVFAFTALRLGVRGFRLRKLGLDDYVIIPGALGAIAYLSVFIVQTTAGCLGKHTYDCTYYQVGAFFEWAQVDYPLFYFSVFTIKLSIALQNRRMTFMYSRNWRVVHCISITTFLILIPLMTVLNGVRCTPVPAIYSLPYLASMKDPEHNLVCHFDSMKLGYASRSVHVVTDVALLSIPIYIAARLLVPWKKKARLVIIFAVGGMSTIASIVRCTRIGPATTDITWDSQLVYAFNSIDITTAAVVANLPALNAFADVVFQKIDDLAKNTASSIRSIIRRDYKQDRRSSSTGELVERTDEKEVAKAHSAPPHVSVYITNASLHASEMEKATVIEAEHADSA